MAPFSSRKANRRPSFNYSEDALYFITLKVENNNCYLGQVANEKVIKTNEGQIVEKQWEWLSIQYPYVILHAFIVMPDHVHGIIEIDHEFNTDRKIKSLSELVGAFKTTSSKMIHLTSNEKFAWQRSFHDHIIRNENQYQLIYNYIYHNPQKWELCRDRSRPV